MDRVGLMMQLMVGLVVGLSLGRLMRVAQWNLLLYRRLECLRYRRIRLGRLFFDQYWFRFEMAALVEAVCYRRCVALKSDRYRRTALFGFRQQTRVCVYVRKQIEMYQLIWWWYDGRGASRWRRRWRWARHIISITNGM